MATESRGFVDVPFDGLDPERLVPTLPGLGLAMQPRDDGVDHVSAGTTTGERSSFEPVAHPGFGDEVAGVRGIGFELAAELGEVHP